MRDNQDNNGTQAEAQRANDTMGSVASEMDGPSGADVTGGDITFPQDADEASQENQDIRIGEEQMWEQQQSGEVGMQRETLKPSPAHPEEGMPENPTGSESSSGGATSTPAAEPSGSFDPGRSNGSTPSAASSEGTDAQGSELAESKEKLAYLAAEFENYKRQAARREAETRERAVKGVMLDLLPVLDNFERAVAAAKNARDMESLRVGVEYILQQLREALRSHGVEPIAAHGQAFDPVQHDALEEVHSNEHPEGTVIEETQSGYSYQGQVLRPSRVKVAGGRKKR